MEDISPDDLAKSLGVSRADVDAMRKKLGIKCVRVDQKWVVPAEKAEIIANELSLPTELRGETLSARAIRAAPNPSWAYCAVEGIDEMTPVLIPRRYASTIVGKTFRCEKIQDKDGVTYRHEYFRSLNSFC